MLLLAIAARAGELEDEPENVIEVVGHGVRVDWTELQMEIVAEAQGAGVQAIEATEQLARKSAEAAFQQAVGSVRVTPDARVADLLADRDLGSMVRSRVSRWEVERATYRSSGGVQLEAVLSLQDLLRPWSLQIAKPGAAPPSKTGVTGVVIDTRGMHLAPAYALRVVSPQGVVLFAGELWEEQAVTQPPFRFVLDPAQPAAAEAGAAPLLLVAEAVRGADVVLGQQAVELVEEAGEGVFGRGTVIVVVDAP
jgi:hypothetical protein